MMRSVAQRNAEEKALQMAIEECLGESGRLQGTVVGCECAERGDNDWRRLCYLLK